MVLKGKRILPGTGHAEGRHLLAQMYRALTGQPMPEILVTERGKPYFAKGPYHFSITHTRHHVFCALGERPVGIDAEEEDRRIDLKLADKILSPGEKKRWQQAEDPRLALLKLWVLKEAAAKCTGRGLHPYPDETDFSPEDPAVQQIDGCLVAVIEEDTYAV